MICFDFFTTASDCSMTKGPLFDMNLFTISFLFDLLCSLHTTVTGDESADFVPDFFGGRRNKGKDSGMGPPRLLARSKARSGPRVLVRSFNFTQRLDHFDKCSRRTWSQRYMVNDAYFQPRPNGPIFIRIGGEGAIFEDDLLDGPLTQLAKEHNALVLSLEHRFYGDSKPTPDLKTKNLRYLSSRQALADLEAFIVSVKEQYEELNPNANVILYGCSYAGTLATFHRRLYSNSTVGAIAGFSPIDAVGNFDQYFDGFFQAIRVESKDCEKQAQQAFIQIMCLSLDYFNMAEIISYFPCDEFRAYTSDQRVAMLHDAIEFCEPKQFNKSNLHSVSSMMYDFFSPLLYSAQYNRKHLNGSSDLGIFCRYMADPNKGQHAFERYGAWRREIDRHCMIHHGKAIQTLSTGWNSDYSKAGTRQWLYQMCSEFGYFLADKSNDVLNISYYMQTCQRSFNILDLEANVKRTNKFYGGKQGMNSTNAYFLSSIADPWHYACFKNEYGTLESIPGTARIIRNMAGISHCLEPIDGCFEEKELVDAWNDIDNYVSQWIGKPRDGPGIFSVC